MENTVDNLIDRFLAAKRVENRTERTIGWYRSQLTAFSDFLGDGARLPDLTLDNARAFVASLQAKEVRYEGHPTKELEAGRLSDYTVHGYVRALKAFSMWLFEDLELTGKDVLAKLKRPKLPETMIEVLTDEEVKKIRAVINPRSFLGARTHLIFVMFYDTGIRANELLTLKLADVDLENDQFKVVGKGRKERILNLNPTTKEAVLNYLFWRQKESEYDNLVLSRDGRPLAPNSLDQLIKRLGRKAGVPRLHPHLLRHSFSVAFLVSSNGNMAALQKLLGHTSILTTQLYAHIANVQIREAHARNSPADRLGIGLGKRRKKAA